MARYEPMPPGYDRDCDWCHVRYHKNEGPCTMHQQEQPVEADNMNAQDAIDFADTYLRANWQAQHGNPEATPAEDRKRLIEQHGACKHSPYGYHDWEAHGERLRAEAGWQECKYCDSARLC